MLSYYGLTRPDEIEPWLNSRPSGPLLDLQDAAELTVAAAALRSPIGRFRFRVDFRNPERFDTHPMVLALRRANGVLELGDEIEHPLEYDDRDHDSHFSSVVGVRAVRSAGVALSSDRLPLHQDGLGTSGSVRYVAMCLDRQPATGGDQAYVNILARGIQLAHRNWKQFIDATRLDAITIVRSSGSQRIGVKGPMFYVDEAGIPAVHFRVAGGEYTVQPSTRVAPWFDEFVTGAERSVTTEQFTPGDCVVVDNLSVVHSRTAFVDSHSTQRRLSRKWFAIDSARKQLRNETSFRLAPQIYGPTARQGS